MEEQYRTFAKKIDCPIFGCLDALKVGCKDSNFYDRLHCDKQTLRVILNSN